MNTHLAINHCGAEAPGWPSGSPPTKGSTSQMTVNYNWDGNTALWSQPWQMTQCNGFHVYSPLQQPIGCNLRVCTCSVALYGFEAKVSVQGMLSYSSFGFQCGSIRLCSSCALGHPSMVTNSLTGAVLRRRTPDADNITFN